MQLADIGCKNCGRPIPARDLDMRHALAKCLACGSAFSFAHWLPTSERTDAVAARPKVEMPRGFDVEDDFGDFVIRRRWFHPALFFLLFFCVAWDSFLIGWYVIAGSVLGELFDGGPGAIFGLFFLIFPLGHVAVGVGLTYTVAAGFLNTTTIRIADGRLSVRHAPLPWGKEESFPVADIDQLFCTSWTPVRRRHNASNFNYSVQAVRTDGVKFKVLGAINDLDHALFIEQSLEDHLGLVDRRVAGEASL